MLLPTIALVVLWLQLFWSLVPTWLHGEYYEYGWFVPFLTIPLAVARLGSSATSSNFTTSQTSRVPSLIVAATIAVIALIGVLRMVSIADPSWRPPLILHALILAACTHFWVGKTLNWKTSIALLPVTLFTLSSVPLPFQIERAIIDKLTGIVSLFTHEILLLQGYPVELRGITLYHGNQMVEVAEGCSGIRSFQSLLMVALFFGELLLLPWFRRIILVCAAALFALGGNMARACILADLHFTHGSEFANRQHDSIGNYAFVTSSILLFIAARLLLPSLQSRRVLIAHSGSASS